MDCGGTGTDPGGACERCEGEGSWWVTPEPPEMLLSCVPQGELLRLRRIEAAARDYFVHYVQDEADNPEDCTCGHPQHERAVELRTALNERGQGG